MGGGPPAEAWRAGSRHQRSPLWSPVNETQAVGANLSAERAGIYPALEHASGVNTGQTIDARIEGIGRADRGRDYRLPRCCVGAIGRRVRIQAGLPL
jgi:hypothetical protein